MKALLLREIKSFFGSPIGYLVIAIFLLLNGLFLWVFDNGFNILNSGFADMGPFFTLSPWILIFLIPAVTMRSFSDEKKQGTLELLFTKPLSVWEIVLGKFVGSSILIALALIPTLVYVLMTEFLSIKGGSFDILSIFGIKYFCNYILLGTGIIYLAIYSLWKILNNNLKIGIAGLSLTVILIYLVTEYRFLIFYGGGFTDFDYGSTMGSYFGLLFLIAGYTAVGIFSSTLSENQIVAFIIAVFLCFVLYFGFEGVSALFGANSGIVAKIGMDYHFKSMSRGVIDTRDVLYFASIAILFLSFTVYKLKSLKW